MNVGAILSSPSDGIRAALDRFEAHADRVSRGEIEPEEVAGLLREERAVEVNVAAMRAEDEMMGTLLDVFA